MCLKCSVRSGQVQRKPPARPHTPPSSGGFTTSSTNSYFPLVVGSELILEGKEDGATIRVEIRVLDEIELVAGVDTRVVEERETERS